MKPARLHIEALAGLEPATDMVRLEGRAGADTLKIRDILLHSRYNPEQEASRLIDSTNLDPARPVLVVGLGLGYHVAELLRRGFELAVLEPDPQVARAALEKPLFSLDILLGVGEPDAVAAQESFGAFARQMPQVLVHPPTARLHPDYARRAPGLLAKAALQGMHLNICVVGPMYGGSEPIAGYLAEACRELGHNTLLVENTSAWPMYQRLTGSVENTAASNQLGELYTRVVEEWTYARVAEFKPEICLVMAQAPAGRLFPARLAQLGIITAFWYVENWRHLPYWKEIAPLYDGFFHIQPGEFETKLTETGCRYHAYVQTGCAPARHCPMTLSPEDRSEFESDLSFAGAGYYNRNQFFKGLTDLGLKLWGVNFHDRLLAPLVQGGEKTFDSETFMKIVAGAKINLNLHSSTSAEGVDPKCDAINPRVFEIAAAGGFQLCDPAIGLEKLFDFETELPVYRTLAECRERVRHFLAHPEERRQIALRAQQRALREHTYAHRAGQMLELLFEWHGAALLRRGVRVRRTVVETLARLDPASELARWLKKLPEDTPFSREALTPLTAGPLPELPYPARLFAYMNEVTDFADTLLKEQR